MPDNELFFDKSPARYSRYYHDRCMGWWETQKKRVQENYDMAMGYDEYMEHKRDMGYSGLTVPLIYVVAEARTAAMWSLLAREEPFFRFDPPRETDKMARIAAERKETAVQNMRNDLRWDDTILDLFYACEFSNHAWLAIEPEEIRIGPEHGLLVPRQMYGTNKLYNTFKLYGAGEILVDGFQKDQRSVPAKMKMAFMPYHQLKLNYPEYVDKWILEHAQMREQSAYSNPDMQHEKSGSDDGESAYYMWQGSDYGGGGDWDSQMGFLVAELHMEAIMSDGTPQRVIYTFLPNVQKGPDEAQNYSYGYPLCPTKGIPFPYESVDTLLHMARARRLPHSMEGKCTSELLFSMQREFSDSIGTERDLDRQYLEPVMAVRSKFLANKERPGFEPGSTWDFADKEGQESLPLRDLAMPLNTSTPNRGYLTGSRHEMQALTELIGASMEATTGGDVGGQEKVGIFKDRARGAAGRINLVFVNHAGTLLRVLHGIMSTMGEAPDQFLRPEIATESKTARRPAALSHHDLQSPSKMGIPALTKYAQREMEQVMWMTVGEVVANNPVGQQSLEMNVLLIEDIIRSQGVGEVRLEEYKQAAELGVQRAMMAAAAAAMPPEIGAPGGQPQSAKLAQVQGGSVAGVG